LRDGGWAKIRQHYGPEFASRAMALQNDRLAVRHDEAGPNQERSRLAEGDLRVVLAHKAGALRDQKNLPGRAVIDVLGDLGCDPAGEIRTQPGQQRGGDHRTGLENIGTGKGLNTIRAHRLPIDVAVQEAQLVVLQADTRRSRGVRLGAREVCRSILSEVSAPTHVLGYYTLCAMVISRGDVPEAARKHVPRYPLVSATLIGRLAVAKERQGQRLGAVLLADAPARSAPLWSWSTRWTRPRPASTLPMGSCGCPTRFRWCCQCAWRQRALSGDGHAAQSHRYDRPWRLGGTLCHASTWLAHTPGTACRSRRAA
jgi:hypothetical protein